MFTTHYLEEARIHLSLNSKIDFVRGRWQLWQALHQLEGLGVRLMHALRDFGLKAGIPSWTWAEQIETD